MTRAIVCGGRDLEDRKRLRAHMNRLHDQHHFTEIIHGCAPGADTAAAEWAVLNEIAIDPHPADWDRYGKRAGFIRNTEMLAMKPDIVIAFPGGRGTAMMVDIAKSARVRVIRFT